jgi:hypothetical protein
LYIGISLIFSSISGSIEKLPLAIQAFFWIPDFLINILLSLGLTKIALDLVDGNGIDFRYLYSEYKLIFKYLTATLLIIALVFSILALPIGVLLLTIYLKNPILILLSFGLGVVAVGALAIFSLKFCLVNYFIVDKKVGPVEALKLSAKATEGAKWNLFIFAIILALLNILGTLALLVGLLATAPTSMVAFAYVYRKLEKSMNNSTPTVPEPPLPATNETV